MARFLKLLIIFVVYSVAASASPPPPPPPPDLEAEVASLKDTVEDLKNEMRDALERLNSDTTDNAVVAALFEIVEVLKSNTMSNTMSNTKSNTKSNTRGADIILLNGESHDEPSGCPRVCSGTTGRGSTVWVYHSDISFYVDVDITGCGFTSVPTVTTSLEGSSHHWLALGTSSVYGTTNTNFRVYIHPNKHEGDVVFGNANVSPFKWNVEWVAVGQSC